MIKDIKNYVKGNAFLLPIANRFLRFTQFARTVLAQKIKKVLGLLSKSSRVGPINYCKVQSYINNTRNREDFVEIYPEHEITRIRPLCIEEQIHWKFELARHTTSPAVFVAKIYNGRLFSNSGVAITEDNIVLEEVSRAVGRHMIETDIFRKVILSRPTLYAETIGVISASCGEGFFHWMFDVLPRISIINQSPWNIDKIAVNSINSKFQEETLRILGLLDKVIILKKDEHIQANELVVPSLPGNTGNMPKWTCDFLKRSFPPVSSNVEGKKRRLYISRASANNGRSVLNETEVVDLLAPLGFERIFSEDLSFQEQVDLFSQAEVVIAPHGAGLSNLVFCNEGTKVLEFFSPNYVNVCFYALSSMVDLEYYYLIGEGKQPSEYCDPHVVGESITVGITSLQKTLSMMGLSVC